ncbi:MAG: hypothetical protein J2O48_12230, partial [Solirubrobacterales bacterium]|nr:hypothetical protein [Solirubrobacterales bacterium]
MIAAAAAGVIADHRSIHAVRVGRGCLTFMFYVLVPYVSFVNFAHLKLTLGAGLGLAGAYVGVGFAALLAYLFGRARGLSGPSLGALIVSVLIVNTAYLGYPMSVALLGSGALTHAVAYDQVVSTPIVFTLGFGVGAAFG